MIGTKIDLEDQRVISIAEAKKTSQKFDCIGDPLETSSKTGENVEEAFLRVSKEIVRQNLQFCKSCGELFIKNLKFCNYCGAKAELEPALL